MIDIYDKLKDIQFEDDDPVRWMIHASCLFKDLNERVLYLERYIALCVKDKEGDEDS